MSPKKWSKQSWKNFNALHQPDYPDKKKYKKILTLINEHPPLVFPGEVEDLKNIITEAGEGKLFILQGGDCAERFIDCHETSIMNKIKILLQMSVILTHGARKPVARIGRIAGQYAKPRSNNFETIENQRLPVFRGDNVNSFEPTLTKRTADPERLLTCLYHSAITLNYIRAMIDGGFTDLHHPYNWNLNSIEKTEKWPDYNKILERILDSINFMESFGGINSEKIGQIKFFTSHEGLLLNYEEALTKKDSFSKKYYNLGAHMVWIGERTRQLDGAHIEYFRGIANPIGIKIGPTCSTEEIIKLVTILNPKNEKGKITLITRLGSSKVDKILPQYIKTIKKEKQNVTWCCDPMHGNTIAVKDGRKTRNFDSILEELKKSFNVHKKNSSHLAGVHFELTGEDVTECIGGAVNLKGEDLTKKYETFCDPRLNCAQSLEMAFLISKMLRPCS